MKPDLYPLIYINLFAGLQDGTVTKVQIRKYLKDGLNPQSPRAKAAQDALLRAIAKELGYKGNLPGTVTIDGWPIQRLSLQRVFMGKGAPDEIQTVLWLASRYRLLNAGNLQTFCDNNIGMDCGGFVACLWGIGKPQPGQAVEGSTGFLPRSFWNMDRSKRRKKAGDIAVGDAIVFFKHVKDDNTDLANKDPKLGGEAYHIGAVYGSVIGSDRIDLGIMESSGAPSIYGADGVNYRIASHLALKTANGLVYADAGSNARGEKVRLYFVGKSGNRGAYLPFGWNDV